MKARYALYAILTLLTFVALPQSVSADTTCFDTIASTTPATGEFAIYYFQDPLTDVVSSWAAIYDNTEICDYNKFTALLKPTSVAVGRGITESLQLYVYELATSTDDINDGELKYISTQTDFFYATSTVWTEVDFNFTNTITTIPGKTYLYIIRPVDLWTVGTSSSDRLDWAFETEVLPNTSVYLANSDNIVCGLSREQCATDPSLWDLGCSR